jgi:hypothetical protein
LKEREHLIDITINEQLIGKCVRLDGMNWILGNAGSCKYGNEPAVSIKGTELLNRLSDCQLCKVSAA